MSSLPLSVRDTAAAHSWPRLGRAIGGRDAHALALLAPAVLLIGVFFVLPNAANFLLAATDWNSYHSAIRYIGLDNFADLWNSGVLSNAIVNTLKFAVVGTIAINVFSLALALALERPTRRNIVLRAVFFLPVLLSTLAAGYVFASISQVDGLINRSLSGLLAPLSIGTVQVEWLGSLDFTIYLVAFVFAWKWFGINMLVYIAGLTAIPDEVVEAAVMEGATGWQIIRRIKMPLLAPAFTFNVTLSLIGALTAFDVIVATTKGGPAKTTEILNFVLFRQMGTGAFGYATAISLVMFLLIVLLSVPLIVWLRRREVEL
jgi:ABC-type sugar transport system permease subunit